jgi:hypothetical protein
MENNEMQNLAEEKKCDQNIATTKENEPRKASIDCSEEKVKSLQQDQSKQHMEAQDW